LGIENKVTYGLQEAMCKKWPKNRVKPKDDTYKMPFPVYSREQDTLVLDMKGLSEVQKQTSPPYVEGPSEEFINKEQSASNNKHNSCNNIDDKMSPTKKAGTP
jgi:hypothetical protein